MRTSLTAHLDPESNLTCEGSRSVVRFRDLSKPVQIDPDRVWNVLDLSGYPGLLSLPVGLTAYELDLRETKIEALPEGLRVRTILDLTNCRELRSLPPDLRVGSLRLRGCVSLESLPENFDVWFLDLTGCWGFKNWPKGGCIRNGSLNLRGCTALAYLPAYLGTLGTLNVRDCSNLRDLPSRLRITGWIDIAHSGLAHLKSIPKSLEGVEVRWQGVRIDERIWLRPESIRLDEILAEKNAELRRVLIERYGQSRFVAEAKCEILDEDCDPGGLRQLMRIPLAGDEPIVTLSCKCPSTQRQYFLRVPPTMNTCRQAAAWMAGYDQPDDYNPLIET